MPIVEIFEKVNKSRKFDAEKSPEEVYNNVLEAINNDDNDMPDLEN